MRGGRPSFDVWVLILLILGVWLVGGEGSMKSPRIGV